MFKKRNGEIYKPSLADFIPVMSSVIGTNADLLPEIFKLYVRPGSIVADVTFGQGVFWKKLDPSNYTLWATDLETGTDFRKLPYEDSCVDVLIIDPPYMRGGGSPESTSTFRYKNKKKSHEGIIRLYAGGILEASRVLRKGGIIIVKTQDEMDSKQIFSHIEIVNLLVSFGFAIIDLFILIQSGVPAMREKYQKSARKNHSYAIVGKFRR